MYMAKEKKSANEQVKRPQVFDVLPPQARGRVFRFSSKEKLTVKKNSRVKADKKFVQVKKPLWLKLCQGSGPALYVIGLIGLIFFLRHTLAALDDKTAKVNFYVNTVRADGAGDWQNIDRALGEPQVSLDGGKDAFTAENSTAYSGGGQSLICENFTTKDFLMTTVGLPIDSAETPEALEEPAVDTAIISLPETPASTSAVELPSVEQDQVADDQSPVEIVEPEGVLDASLTEVITVENHLPSNDVVSEQPVEEIIFTPTSPSSDPVVESLAPNGDSQPAADAAPEASVETIVPSESAESGEVSFISEVGKILAGFKIRSASAQENINADDRDMIFGRFRSAVIRMSLASFDQALVKAVSENIEPDVSSPSPEEPTSSSTVIVDFSSSSSAIVSEPLPMATSSEPLSWLEQVLRVFALKTAQAQVISATPKVVIWYSLDGGEWTELTTISSGDLSNYENGGYLSFNAPFLAQWKDVDNLRLKFEGRADNGGDFSFYLDGVWVEVEYQPAPLAEGQIEISNPDEVEVDGEKIEFNYTDENSNENFIIKTDRKDYFGLANATVYFNVTNVGFREEDLNLKFYFPSDAGEVTNLEKLEINVPYAAESPHYSSKVFECANGWDKREGYYQCYPSEEKQDCDLVSPNRRYCRLDRVDDGVVTEIKYHNRWSGVPLTQKYSTSTSGFFHRLLNLVPETKDVPESFSTDKATHDSVALIRPGETKYFKMDIAFSPNSEGEFYIEALGNSVGYGLLDPWWSSGWSFRLPITIDNRNNANALTDYQTYIQISSTTKDFWRNIKADGGDIRFVDSTETVELDYWRQYFDYTASSTRIWVKVPYVPAASTTKIFLYYGNGSATNNSNQYTPFSYSSVQELYRVVSVATSTHIHVVSLIDDNSVQVDNGSAVALSRQSVTTFDVYTASSTIKAKGPIGVKFSGGAATLPALPVSFAGTSFTVPASRDLEIYNILPLSVDATSTIYDGLANENQQLITAGHSRTIISDIATGSPTIIEATNAVLVSLTTNGPGDGLAVYPSSGEDLYGIKSQYNIISATATSSFDILCSSRASSSVSALARGSSQNNTVCSGAAEGAGEAVRLNVKSGKIGAIQQDDSDGRQATMFLPFRELSSEYILPTDANYLAVVCPPEVGNIVLSIYDFSNAFISSTTCSGLSNRYPGKAYFGDADIATYAAGARIVSSGGQPFYVYYEDDEAFGAALGGDETNLWGAVQGRKYAYPAPVHSFGVHEIKGPPVGTFNSAIQSGGGDGRILVSIEVDDITNDDSRARIDYVLKTGNLCDFSSPLDPTLSEGDADISADFGDPKIYNKDLYQIGTSTGWIKTASGSNTVLFNWTSKSELPVADGVYCLRLTVNDQLSDQAISATTSLNIDNVRPTTPGNLTVNKKTGTSITFNLPATSTEAHFQEYKIFYKIYDGSPADESGTLFGSSSDADFGNSSFNKTVTTTISGLTAGLRYTFNLFAYDQSGNKASSSASLNAYANDVPVGYFNSAQQKTDGSGRVDISIEADDANDSNTVRAKIDYGPYLGANRCDFSSPAKPTIDSGNFSSDFGSLQIDNNDQYQIGTTSFWIITSPGSNTVNFDWLSAIDLSSATGTYCLRLTLNDLEDDQFIPATTTLTIDNVRPTIPGNLTVGPTTYNSIELLFPLSQASSDDNPSLNNTYRVFYKLGTAGVRQSDIEHDSAAFDAYNFGGLASTTVSGLNGGSNYVFNIWAYDAFGNYASATAEAVGSTDGVVTNKGLVFIDSQSTATTSNIAVADGVSAWTFRAQVQDSDGWGALNYVELRLANKNDYSAPFDDLKFKWDAAGDTFTEIGPDAGSMAAIAPSSASNCSDGTCYLNFKIIFNKSFATSSLNYSAQLYSIDTDGTPNTDLDTYIDLFQTRKTWLDQRHYRWRNDDGGG